MARPCLEPGCPHITTGTNTRCTNCQRIWKRAKNASQPHHRGGWAKLAKQQRERQPWCSQCGARTDLTADHVTPGSLAGGLDTLCRSCNSSKGAR